MANAVMEKCIALRKRLHLIPEVSGQEVRTRETILAFLKENTDLEIHEEGLWLWAVHREAGAQTSIALRADFDAVPVSGGGAQHLCGHDGHAAALCALGMMISGSCFGKNIYLIFQHAEETGEGARECAKLIGREKIGAVYGLHNLPGYPFGQIQLKKGTFACASRGLILSMKGSSAHAAYPENGKNPAFALCGLVSRLDALLDPADYEAMVMATVVGVRAGQRAFGMAASEGEVCLTLRAHKNRDLEKMEKRILDHCADEAAAQGMAFSFERADVFPATENHDACVALLERALGAPKAYLAEPMRWSEDFGWYLIECPGAFFGVGAGVDHPALHTPDYEYPDALLEVCANAFLDIVKA